MSNVQQSFDAGQTQSQAQGKTEEWIESTKATANAAKDRAADVSESTKLSVQQERERTDFLHQTGEKVVNMAQGAVDTVKNTLGMGERNK